MDIKLTKEECEALINLLSSYASPVDKALVLNSILDKCKKEYNKDMKEEQP